MHIWRITLLLCQLKRQGTINFLSLHFQFKCHQIRIKHVRQLLSLPDLPLSRVQGVKVVEQLSTNMKWDLCSIFFFISFAVPKLPSSVGSKSFCSFPVLSLSRFWVLNFVRKDDVPLAQLPPKGNRLIRKEAASAPQRKIVLKSEETTNRGVPHCSENFAHPLWRPYDFSPFEEENFSDSPIRVPLSLIWLFLNGTHVQFWILILKMTAVERGG